MNVDSSVDLDPESIWRSRTGRDAVGRAHANVYARLAALCASLRRQEFSTLLGRYLSAQLLAQSVANYISIVESDWRSCPEASAPVIQPAIVITGLPRTGSTLLQNLLALHESAWSLPACRALSPASPPSDEIGRTLATNRIRLLRRLAPDALEMHPLTIDGPEECNILWESYLTSFQLAVYFNLPGYLSELKDEPQGGNYSWHQMVILHLLGERPGRHVVLKSAGHLFGIDELLRRWTPITVVQLERDPEQQMDSWFRLVSSVRGVFGTAVSPRSLKAEWVPYWSAGAQRFSSEAGELGLDILRFDYEALVADPIRIVTEVQDRAGVGTTAQQIQAMRALLAWVGCRQIVPEQASPFHRGCVYGGPDMGQARRMRDSTRVSTGERAGSLYEVPLPRASRFEREVIGVFTELRPVTTGDYEYLFGLFTNADHLIGWRLRGASRRLLINFTSSYGLA